MATEQRVLRPKEKRRPSSLYNNSLLYGDDDITTFSTPSKSKDKKKIKGNKKQKTKRGSIQLDMGGDLQTQADFDFTPYHEEGEGIFVIDDPSAYYLDDRDSDEERRKRTAQKQERESEQLRLEEGLRKKKKKRHASGGTKKYHTVPVDATGAPIMPIELRGLTIHSLGTIVYDRKKFHAKRYIWPAGFKSSRVYCSMTNLNDRCEYYSEIVDADSEPKFVVTCYEDPKNPIVIEANTPSGAWAQVGKRINDLKEALTGKRPEMFGFSHPTIAKLIQELPNAAMCDKYIFQDKKNKRSKKKSESSEDEFDEEDEEGDDDGEDSFETDDDDDEDEEDDMRGGKDDGRRGSLKGSSNIPQDQRRSRRSSYPNADDWEDEDEESGTFI